MDLNTLPVEELFTIDLETIAVDLEIAIEEYIKPSPDGIYIKSKLEPIMVDGNEYYTKVNDNYIPVEDINLLTSAVYNKEYKVIIPTTFIKNKTNFISNQSFLPYRGIKITEVILKDYINEILQYTSSNRNIVNKILCHLNIDVNDELLKENLLLKIDDVLLETKHVIRKFISRHDWYIYTPRLKDKVFKLEKNMDFRVYEWYRMQESENDSER